MFQPDSTMRGVWPRHQTAAISAAKDLMTKRSGLRRSAVGDLGGSTRHAPSVRGSEGDARGCRLLHNRNEKASQRARASWDVELQSPGKRPFTHGPGALLWDILREFCISTPINRGFPHAEL